MTQNQWYSYLLVAAALVVAVGIWQVAIGNMVNGVLAIVIAALDVALVLVLARGKRSSDR